MQVTINWESFDDSQVSMRVRKEIVQALGWIRKVDPDVLNIVGEELLAQRMLNIYLIGKTEGLNQASKMFDAQLKSIGHHRGI